MALKMWSSHGLDGKLKNSNIASMGSKLIGFWRPMSIPMNSLPSFPAQHSVRDTTNSMYYYILVDTLAHFFRTKKFLELGCVSIVLD